MYLASGVTDGRRECHSTGVDRMAWCVEGAGHGLSRIEGVEQRWKVT